MRILMLMFLAGLAGCGDVRTDRACGTEAPPPPQVTVLRVQQCWLNEKGDRASLWSGTGFPISSNGVISYRHELPPGAPVVLVEGEVASVLDRGNDEREWDDWIYVQLQSAPDQVPIVDPKLELRAGERVAVVGFSAHGVPKGRAKKWTDFQSRTVYGKIVSKPSWLGIPDEIVFVKSDEGMLEGMSGGPVMFFRDNKWVVFGVMVGKVRQDILNGLFSSKLFYARRIPEHLLEK